VSRPGNRIRSRDRGAAAVEMALVTPLLLLVLFGIIDFGRMLNCQINLTEAAREGARAAAVANPPSSGTSAASSRIDLTLPAGMTGVQKSISACSGPSADASVTLQYSYEFITPLGAIASMIGGAINSSWPLTGKGVMPCAG
jgi:Flp pilus assembly protein TadG